MLRFRAQQPPDFVLAETARETKRAVGMTAMAVTDRANERELVGHLGMLGQKFAHLDARHVRFDGIQWPPNFCRGRGLHVVRFELARTTAAPEQNYGSVT